MDEEPRGRWLPFVVFGVALALLVVSGLVVFGVQPPGMTWPQLGAGLLGLVFVFGFRYLVGTAWSEASVRIRSRIRRRFF